MTHRSFLGNLVTVVVWPMTIAFSAEPGFEEMNAAFGAPIWVDENLWDDPDQTVGERLQWPLESRTETDSSYRAYAGSKVRILGARPFSLALYGREGTPTQISMVFANKGDWAPPEGERGARADGYAKSIAADTQQIGGALTNLLGPPVKDRFGKAQNSRESVHRWDWKGHSILLASPRGEYVAVRIVPTELLDADQTERVADSKLREELAKRVERRENGDVILKNMPMVNQGPKGYCVPATWERVLRYMGIPADMYVLAMAGQTAAGGGTNTSAMMAGASDLVRAAGRRMSKTGGRLTPRMVSRYIDQGMPLLWSMYVIRDVNRGITERSAQRRKIEDWNAYKETLETARREARRIRIDRDGGHMCMIIGYNAETDEIAISDSWGPQFAERWITIEEANAISQNDFTIIEL